MKRLHQIKESPNYQRLRDSVQYRYDKRQFIIISIFWGLIFLLELPAAVLAVERVNTNPLAFFMLLLLGMMLLVLWAYFAYRWLEIFLYIDDYIFCRVQLDQPHLQGRGAACFTVEFTDRHGKQLKRDTNAIFSSDWEPFLEEYNNQAALIGYNAHTDRVVLIQRLDT